MANMTSFRRDSRGGQTVGTQMTVIGGFSGAAVLLLAVCAAALLAPATAS